MNKFRPERLLRAMMRLYWKSCLCSLLAGWPLVCGTAAGLAPAREAAYARATNQAGTVLFFKPATGSQTSLVATLAPFILHSIAADAPTNHLTRIAAGFGVPLPGDDATNAVVYTRMGVWRHGERRLTQVFYFWLYPPEPPPARNPQAVEPLPGQGVRLTLNASGHPVLWEVLAADGGLREVYVAGSVEHAARQTFTHRQPGRRWVIEPAQEQAPELVVPLILEDSAVVFGPMVYLTAARRTPHSVICRCMPALASELAGTHYFALRPWPDDARARLRQRPDGGWILKHLDEFERHQPLAGLRLPPVF